MYSIFGRFYIKSVLKRFKMAFLRKRGYQFIIFLNLEASHGSMEAQKKGFTPFYLLFFVSPPISSINITMTNISITCIL